MTTIPQALSTALEYHQAGRLQEAEGIYRQILKVDPKHAEALHLLGVLARNAGQTETSIDLIRRAIESNSSVAVFHCNLGVALWGQGKLDEAVACYARALQLQPHFVPAHSNLGVALQGQGKLNEAVASYERALQINPDHVETQNNLGSALREQGKLEEAVARHRRALQLDPNHGEAHTHLGFALKEQGKLAEAVASYRRALKLNPHNAKAHSSLLFLEHYLPSASLAGLATAHAEWQKRHAAPLQGLWRPFSNPRDPERPLRLGFVSADFGRHPVGYFFVACLEALQSKRCETVCYSDRVNKDEMTARIAAAADTWRDVSGLSHQRLADQIRHDKIDVAFDLAGHCANNRMLVFARKPAPIQVTWIGYVGTTGLAAMDYLFADRFHIPEQCDAHYQEQVVRLPQGRFCYDPPADAPQVGSLPAYQAGGVTFGSFNNLAKLTSDVVACWAEIVRQVPRSRLILKYRGLDQPSTAQRYLRLFADHQVEPARLELRGRSPYHQMLAEYNEIDVALDPYPFAGATTTCEALWMGVPVVTCPMETFTSRQTLGILSSVGMTQTVARDLQHYVQLAVELAHDLPRIAQLRAGMRQQMAKSPLCDAEGFTASFMKVTGEAWRAWCQRDDPN